MEPTPERQYAVELVLPNARSGGVFWRGSWLSADDDGIWRGDLVTRESVLVLRVLRGRLNLAVGDSCLYWATAGEGGDDVWSANLDDVTFSPRRVARNVPFGELILSSPDGEVWMVPDCRHETRLSRLARNGVVEVINGNCGEGLIGNPRIVNHVLYQRKIIETSAATDRDILVAYDLRGHRPIRIELPGAYAGLTWQGRDAVLALVRTTDSGLDLFRWSDPTKAPGERLPISRFANEVAHVDADARSLFIATTYGWIYELPLDGSSPRYIAEAAERGLIEFTIHDGMLYWETSHGILYRMSVGAP